MTIRNTVFGTSLVLLLIGCGADSLNQQVNDFGGRGDSDSANEQLPPELDLLDRSRPSANPDRNAYFGDLHVHTEYSFDAYNFGTTATPYDAYRYAQGEALQHPLGYDIQLQTPLDFYAVTDHAMFLGLVKEAADTSTEFSRYPVSEPIHNINDPDNMSVTSVVQRITNFASFIPDTLAGIQDGSIDRDLASSVTRRAWLDTIEAADQFNDPGRFTTFVGYEYTSSSYDNGNLHRNVIFQGSKRLPAVPFSRLNSRNPEGLWAWMDSLREQGVESLAIPHNSNGSNGQMFKLEDWAGSPLDDDYAEQRMRNEPLVEVTQVKGTSDTHPVLSPNDEWADFEIYPLRVGSTLPSEPRGSYVREALLNGLKLQGEGMLNPFQFGLVGSTDTHVAGGSDREETYFSKAGILDGTPEGRGSIPLPLLERMVFKLVAPNNLVEVKGRTYAAGSAFETWSASGFTGVWAEENTREAIYDAFRRKETFATTGPRIRVRFFGGFEYFDALLDDPAMIGKAYAAGVSMGGELAASTRAPSFLVWASGDPLGVPLQRMQVIKGFIRDGEHVERIYDVACSDGLSPDPQTQRCPDNGAQVNLDDCTVSANLGSPELLAHWRDPDFDPAVDAFYYVRVLENPSCRWSTWDAIRAGVEPRDDLPATIQERAWSSPIWYRGG